MKSKIFLPFISLGLLLSLVSCNDSQGDGEPISFKEKELVVDIYAEHDLALENSDGKDLSFESSDTDIATVDDKGHVSCQGKAGTVTITVKSNKETDTCSLSIKNQMINPTIFVDEIRGFVNVATPIDAKVRYDGGFYPLSNFTLATTDSSIVTVSGTSIKGVSVGEAEVKIEGVWKGKSLSQKSFNVIVSSESAIILPQTTYDLYDVDNDTSSVKKSSFDIVGEVYSQGKIVDSGLTVTLEANNYATAVGNKISVKNHYSSVEPVSVNAIVSALYNPTITENITINVHSGFEQKELLDEVKESNDDGEYHIDLDIVDYADREDVLKYEIPDLPGNRNTSNPAWTRWATRVEFYETMTKNGVIAYDSLVEKGYQVLAYDIYYTGQKGVLIGAYGADGKDYFYNNERVNRDNIVIVNSEGIATNTLKQNEWMTVYIKLEDIITKSLTTTQNSAALMLGPCFIGDVTYLDNVRYYYDLSVFKDLDIEADLDVRELTVDSTNEAKATSDNEFVVYSPKNVIYSKVGDYYKYDSKTAESDSFDRQARSKIYPYNVYNGYAIRNGYKYISFTYKHEEGSPIISYYDLSSDSAKEVNLASTTSIRSNYVSLYQDGCLKEKIENNNDYTVVIRIDGKGYDSFHLTSNSDTVFYIKDFAYYKDQSYIAEFGYNPIVSFYDETATVYIGDKTFDIYPLSKSYTIDGIVQKDSHLVDIKTINFTVLSGSEHINIDKNYVTGVSQGVAIVKGSITVGAVEYYDTIRIEVMDHYHPGDFTIVKSGTSPATYTQYEGTIAGVTNPHAYTATVASWDNKLDIDGVNHLDKAATWTNINKKHIKYVTFSICLTAGSNTRIYCVEEAGHTTSTFTAGSTITNLSNHTNMKVYDQDGNLVTSSTIIAANTWYAVVVDYTNIREQSIEKSLVIPCVEFSYSIGTIYLNDCRYYMDTQYITDYGIQNS